MEIRHAVALTHTVTPIGVILMENRPGAARIPTAIRHAGTAMAIPRTAQPMRTATPPTDDKLLIRWLNRRLSVSPCELSLLNFSREILPTTIAANYLPAVSHVEFVSSDRITFWTLRYT